VLCLEQKVHQGDKEKTIKEIESLRNKGIIILRKSYFKFGIIAVLNWICILILLSKIILKNRIYCIHSLCTPPGVFAYLLAKCWKRKLVLDSYEPHAEAMVENGSWKKDSKAFNILFNYERKMTERADYIIGATKGMKNYAKEKYNVEIKNFFVKPACVDLERFSINKPKEEKLLKELNLEGYKIMLYAGKFGGIYFDQEIFDYIRVASEYFGKDKFRVLILSNISKEDLEEYCRKANLDSSLIVLRFIKHKDIHRYMNLADYAICPVKPIPSKKYCTPIKNGEYWAMGLPVVIPKEISDDSDIIVENNIGYVLQKMDVREYRKSCEIIDKLINQSNIAERIQKVAVNYRDFEVARKVYKEIYQDS
jgi:glycosyltransferase involved in cell wall biosynthesis